MGSREFKSQSASMGRFRPSIRSLRTPKASRNFLASSMEGYMCHQLTLVAGRQTESLAPPPDSWLMLISTSTGEYCSATAAAFGGWRSITRPSQIPDLTPEHSRRHEGESSVYTRPRDALLRRS